MSSHQHYKLSDPNQYFVMTWNVGTDKTFDLLEKTAISKNKSGLVDLENIRKFRDQRINTILSHSKADLFLLQEVGKEENRIKNWIDINRYGVIFGDHQDTAIIYNKQKFELAMEVPSDPQKAFYTIAKLKEKQTGKYILAVSIHLTECDPLNPVPIDACDGDGELQFVLDQIDASEKPLKIDANIIGISTSTVADYSGRIGKLRENSYIIDEFDIPTQIKLSGPHTGKTYKIDYFGTRSVDGIVSIDSLKDDSVTSLELGNPRDNPSDHQPLLAKVELAQKPFWSRIFE